MFQLGEVVSTSCSSSKSLVGYSSSGIEAERRVPKAWQLENGSFKHAARNLHLLEGFGASS